MDVIFGTCIANFSTASFDCECTCHCEFTSGTRAANVPHTADVRRSVGSAADRSQAPGHRAIVHRGMAPGSGSRALLVSHTLNLRPLKPRIGMSLRMDIVRLHAVAGYRGSDLAQATRPHPG